ncbi:hypothetical protein OMP38_14570 [Cohnella ginsengisoli]|uniref:Uncharacterized protein n=1 Tax=Cohnella ginsengisoli TaxID=425004 RepID=A0A9X4KHL6_9BACL|nr:hypothetical protein [Cohnella ginsengisoli]MDG0791941.1 hypothetical protein [Cohnella ginsengisoli]
MVEKVEFFLNDTFIKPFNYVEGSEDGNYLFYTDGTRTAAFEIETGDLFFAEDNDLHFINDDYLSKWTRKMLNP